VGQGCIAIEAATSLDADKLSRVRGCLNDADSEACLLAERAFLKKLEGGCSIPAFGLAVLEGNEIILHAGLASLDGQKIIHRKENGSREDAEKTGERAGEYILENGGREMLAEIRKQQER
jgi:hydroxymethylbilane synthase